MTQRPDDLRTDLRRLPGWTQVFHLDEVKKANPRRSAIGFITIHLEKQSEFTPRSSSQPRHHQIPQMLHLLINNLWLIHIIRQRNSQIQSRLDDTDIVYA
jgi:hypothetical protein